MRKIYLMVLACTGMMPGLFAQDSLQATIVLIGDAGQLTNGHQPVVSAVKNHIPLNKKTTIIYLGDNLYKTGLPDNSLPSYALAKAPLDSQIHIAGKTDAKVYFVPGNHDWANGGSLGYESILRVQSYIDILSNKNVAMLPRDGCPGPVEVKINDQITVIIMDSQWWLQETDKPGIESDCPFKTKDEVLVQLDDLLAKNSNKLVILAMHHPMRSYGQHGGYFTFKQHIFPFTDMKPNFYLPLPILGSAYPLTRAVFGTSQDLKHPFYQAMIGEIEKVVKGHKNVVFVAGHEHTLQMIQDSSYNYIISGSGSKTSRVSKSRNTLFAASENGFATLEISKNKNVRVTFYGVKGDSMRTLYSNNILDFSRLPIQQKDTLRQVEYAFKDSVVISASDKYKNYSGFKNVILGSNYRKEWSTPVTLKVFNIRKEKGGLTIESLGGGKQTKSLKLKDKDGNEWVLRSVDKDPEKALPPNLRNTIAQGIVEDVISASNPYAPLVVPFLSKAVNVPTPDPEFFFIPDDISFGYYRPLFANTVCILESRNPDVYDKNTKSTDKILSKMYEDNDNHVDQEKVLNARLLDMLIGDFDRHADQWRWGTADTGKGKLYYPIPKDRDQAFFLSNGLAIQFLSRNRMRFLQGFTGKVKDINGINYVARNFDRLFLNNLEKAAWEKIARTFQQNLTDDVIKNSFAKLPQPIALQDSAMIEKKLVTRRNELLKDALHYYKFISRVVSVVGSNKEEYFHVKNNPAGIELTVYKKNERTDSATVMYQRVFNARETKEIRLFGLNSNDKFEIDPDVDTRIKFRIIGGKGNDTFNIRGNVKNLVYDLSTENNIFLSTRRTTRELSSDVSVIDYKNNDHEYNKTLFPLINIGYNVEDNFLAGLGFLRRTYGFRNEPYATSQRLSTLYAPSGGAYQAKYQGIFNHVVFKNDLIVNVEIVDPTLNNFYGYGNESINDKTKPKEYYRVRNNYFQADLLLRKRYKDLLQLSVGPYMYYYWNNYIENKDRILNNPALIGSDSSRVYSKKHYIGFKVKLDIDYVNNELFPTRGITWYTDFTNLNGLNRSSFTLTKLNSDMTVYASISDKNRLSAVLRAGGGHIFSKDFEYFQAMDLGANNYLRGFRKNRFAGRSMLYESSELRYRLFKSRSYIFPGDIGILGFFDIGRVWQDNEHSKKWHNAYGGGLYYVPYSLVSLALSVGISSEDKLLNISLGTKFNINF
ncbi:MAG: metallophosphoesterase [Ferruginibacter sp.]